MIEMMLTLTYRWRTNNIISGEEHGSCSGCLPRVTKGVTVQVFTKLLLSNDDNEYFPEYVIA